MVMFKVHIPDQTIYIDADDEIDAEIEAEMSGDIYVESVDKCDDLETRDDE